MFRSVPTAARRSAPDGEFALAKLPLFARLDGQRFGRPVEQIGTEAVGGREESTTGPLARDATALDKDKERGPGPRAGWGKNANTNNANANAADELNPGMMSG